MNSERQTTKPQQHQPAPAGGLLQRAAVTPAAPELAPPIVHDVLRTPGQPLDATTRAFMEPRFGRDFGDVRVHADAQAADSARAVNALAYTVGSDVVFGAGQHQPQSEAGKRLIAHELTHVVQQRGNTINSLQLAGGASSASAEIEASHISKQVTQAAHIAPISSVLASAPLAIYRAAAAQQSAPASSPAAQPAPKAQVAEAARSALNDEAQVDALKIKKILQENTWLGPNNQSDIMAIAEKWANRPMETPYSRLSSFDYFIAALRRVTFTVGWVVKQFTGVFDQIFHRMSNERVARFKGWMQVRGRIFKDEKAIEMAKFEVSKEDLLEAAELSAEVAAAFATGGGSVLLQIGTWLLRTLPGLYQKAKTIIEFVDALRNIKLEDLKKFVTAKGLGGLVVGALFGETPNLPVLKQSEGEEQKEPASASEEKGLVKVLHVMVRIFNALKKVYGKVAEAVNSALSVMNITTKPWFDMFSMVYAAVVKALQAMSDPGAVLGAAVGKIRESVSSFFKGIRTKVETSAGDIKAHVELIGKPAQLLRTLADKAVEMVLNFIIRNPPSALVKLAFKAIETGAKKSILELVREHIPFAETLFKKIAESDTVKRVLQPLEGPIAGVTGAIESVTTKATTLIGDTESRILALLGSGADLVKRLIGMSPSPTKAGESPAAAQPGAEAAKPAEQPEATGDPSTGQGDFLGVVKQGIHARLLASGERNLIQKGKALGKAALEKGKAAAQGLATKVKGMLLGPKVDFTAAGEKHELWVEQQGEDIITFVASKGLSMQEKIIAYKVIASKIQDKEKYNQSNAMISQLEQLNSQVKINENTKPTGYTAIGKKLRQDMALILKQLEQLSSLNEQQITLHLPNAKAIHEARYQSLANEGRLIHDVSYIRPDVKQREDWKKALAPGAQEGISQDKFDEAINLGIEEDAILIPNWAPNGQPALMQVDHIFELQVLSLHERSWADGTSNWELLDTGSNRCSGDLIKNSIAEDRRRLAKEKNDQSWIVTPLKFNKVKARTGFPGRRWQVREIQEGKHIEVWKRTRARKPVPGGFPRRRN